MSAVARRIWAPILAALCLGYLLLMVVVGTPPERVHLIRYETKGVMAQKHELVTQVRVQSPGESDGQSVAFERAAEGWRRVGDDKTLSAELSKSLSLAVKFMHTAEPVRVFKASEVAADANETFGLTEPALSLQLWTSDGIVLDVDFGHLSNDGLLHYMRIKGRSEFFMMSRFVLHEWQTVLAGVK